ncbi:MAG: RimK family alpha-L-glutamate ligase [Planctomycetota bacterium]
MRFAVLASPESWYLRDLRRAAREEDEIVALPFSTIATVLGDRGMSVTSRVGDAVYDWSQFAAVLVRTMPPGSLEQVIFRMDVLGQYERRGGVVVNPPRSIEVAVDKFLTSARLQAAGLATPRTIVCQTVDEALDAFDQLQRDVVIKPLFGGEGRGISRVNDRDIARRVCQLLTQLGAVLYLQEFIAHDGHDIRIMWIGDDYLAMRRHNPLDWRTNVSRGAVAEAFTPTAEMIEIARRAAAAVGAGVAGVDLLPARDGRLVALEVNAVPGWQALGRVTGVDVAALVWRYVRSLVDDHQQPMAP